MGLFGGTVLAAIFVINVNGGLLAAGGSLADAERLGHAKRFGLRHKPPGERHS